MIVLFPVIAIQFTGKAWNWSTLFECSESTALFIFSPFSNFWWLQTIYPSLSSIIDALENACNSRLWTLTTSINCCQKWHIVIETLCYLLSLGCVSTSIKKHLKVKAKTKNRLYYFLNKKRQYFSLILEKTASINCCHKWRILIETLCLLLSLGCVSTPMNYYSFKFSLYI